MIYGFTKCTLLNLVLVSLLHLAENIFIHFISVFCYAKLKPVYDTTFVYLKGSALWYCLLYSQEKEVQPQRRWGTANAEMDEWVKTTVITSLTNWCWAFCYHIQVGNVQLTVWWSITMILLPILRWMGFTWSSWLGVISFRDGMTEFRGRSNGTKRMLMRSWM